MHPYRADYPVLIVRGNLDVDIQSDDYDLYELSTGKNFNPPAVPYEGQSDWDTWDVYPNEIRGLIHVVGSTGFDQTAHIEGTLLCKGTVTVRKSAQITHDPGLAANPPQGYTYLAGMKASPGSFLRVVD
jgi:hypothetical protein